MLVLLKKPSEKLRNKFRTYPKRHQSLHRRNIFSLGVIVQDVRSLVSCDLFTSRTLMDTNAGYSDGPRRVTDCHAVIGVVSFQEILLLEKDHYFAHFLDDCSWRILRVRLEDQNGYLQTLDFNFWKNGRKYSLVWPNIAVSCLPLAVLRSASALLSNFILISFITLYDRLHKEVRCAHTLKKNKISSSGHSGSLASTLKSGSSSSSFFLFCT